jgi:hypothetical protein
MMIPKHLFRPQILWLAGLLIGLLWTGGYAQQDRVSPNAGLSLSASPTTLPMRPFINRGGWVGYWNYAGQPYSPTTATVRSHELYDRLGTHLLRGYPLLSWLETRSDSVGLQESSLVRKNYLFEFFSQLVVATDSYNSWNFAVIAGDNIRTSLTPLTLRAPRWQGVRIDGESPRQGFTLLLTRGSLNRFSAFDARKDLSPVLAYGGHYYHHLNDVLTLGTTLFNQHQVDVNSKQGSFTSGTQPYQMQTPRRIIVRVESDAPDIGTEAGAYGMDMVLTVVAEDGGKSQLTLVPNPPTGGQRQGEMYRVSGLGDAVDFSFDLPLDARVIKAIIRADVAGDYRISVRQIHDFTYLSNDQLETEERSWPSTPTHTMGGRLYPIDFKPDATEPFFTVARAEGKPGLQRRSMVEFEHGIPSGKTLLGTDFKIVANELMAEGEIVYNSEERHFPFASDSLDLRGKKATEGSWAYTFNVRRPFSLGGMQAEWGGEFFRMDPDYSGGYDSRRGGTVFFTDKGGPRGTEAFSQEFPLVEDNDDGDRYPDDSFEDGGRYAASIPGSFGATPWAGVFPGLDADGDQTPDNDKDRNGIPDWSEPFLHYDSDPADFVYGIDLNNNTQPDFRENDNYADYPIRKDQRGYHTFVGFDGPTAWLEQVAVGFYDMNEIAGAGEARSTYVRASAGWQPGRGVRFELHDDAKLVEDSIRDDVYAWAIGDTALFGPNTNTPSNPPPQDPLAMRKSLVNTAFLGATYQPLGNLQLDIDLLHFYNRQREIEEAGAVTQESDSFSELALVTRGEYRRDWSRVDLWVGGKFALKEGRRGPAWAEQSIRFFGPITRVSYTILDGMTFQWGMSGFPGLPTRFIDNEDESLNYEERKMVFMLNGRTDDYQGFIVNIGTGLELHRRDYDEGDWERDFDSFGLFVEIIIGN